MRARRNLRFSIADFRLNGPGGPDARTLKSACRLQRAKRGQAFFLQSVIAIAALLLASCSQRITDLNLNQVKSDMTTKEVESILGQPTRVESSPELKMREVKTLPVVRYLYVQDGRTVELTFVGDRLATGGVNGSFQPPAPSNSPATR